MIVQCDACNTKFKLDDSKIKDRGVKVRCTKCQNVFTVMPPPSEEAAPKQEETFEASFGAQPEPSPKTEGIDFGGLSEQSAAQKQEEKKEEASQWGIDFTFDEKPKEEEKKSEWDIGPPSSKEEAPFSFEEEKEAPKPEGEKGGFGFEIGKEPAFEAEKKEAVPSPELSGFSFEGDFAQTAEKTSFEIEPPPTEEEFVVPPKEEAKTLIMGAQSKEEAKTLIMESPLSPKAQPEANEMSFKAPSEKRKISAPIIISAVIILLLAAGGAVIYLNIGAGFLSKPAAPQKTMDIIGLQGYYINNTSLGRLFVIEGKLVSNLNAPKEVTGMHGMIFDKMGKTIKDVWVAPGRIVARDELKAISAADLGKRFKDRNGTIPPKGTVPFMIVFQGVSGELAEFSVEVGQ
ncbi:MAG: DUF3426 domain-containing protein [Deltaproteobacteria bacterium]|nr:DUF3426 domain-containing protein [Deltaproteobacteria bacterium]